MASIFAAGLGIFMPAATLLSFISVGGAAAALAIRWWLGASGSALVGPLLQLSIASAWAIAAPALVATGAPALLILGLGLVVYAITVSINYSPELEPGL